MRSLIYAVSLTCLMFLLSGCASTGSPKKEAVEKGRDGTRAYLVQIETSEPGARIEANGDFIGTSPVELKIFGDEDGSFHNFGAYEYIIRASPVRHGQYVQTKVFRTGGWFMPEDRIPNRVFFDLNLVPSGVASISPNQPTSPRQGRPSPTGKTGTAFFISEDGFFITNHHVVEDAQEIKIKLGDKLQPARLIKADRRMDLAILKIEGEFKTLPMSSSKKVRLGERVYTLGFPLPDIQGQAAKFTDGSISSLTGFRDDAGEFQISVPVQPGNSGGPLVNQSGEVIGVVVSRLIGAQHANYAIKSSHVMLLLEEIPGLKLNQTDSTKTLSQEEIASRLEQATRMVVVSF